MERFNVDLLYSGMIFAAVILSAGTGVLLTAAFVTLLPWQRKSAPRAATISSSSGNLSFKHGAKEPTPSRSLP